MGTFSDVGKTATHACIRPEYSNYRAPLHSRSCLINSYSLLRKNFLTFSLFLISFIIMEKRNSGTIARIIL